jgi:hypothetical protein
MRVNSSFYRGSMAKVRRLVRGAGRRFARLFAMAVVFVHRQSKKLYRITHHHVAHHPHQKLMQRQGKYASWHNWEHHHAVHYATLGAYLLVVGVLLFSNYRNAYAASDLTQNWDFSNAANYTFDDTGVETQGSSARLKAQNYNSDAQTAALYHLDETSGTTVDDASANANDATSQTAGWTAGNLNNALDLNGADEYASAPDSASLSLSGQNTLEAWTKFDSTFSTNASQDQGVIDKGAYKLYYDQSSGKINYEIANTSGNTWTRQAGNDSNNSWDLDGKTIVRATVTDGTDVYVGLGLGTGDAEVWKWDGSVWSQIGGDAKNGSWADQQFEDVMSLTTNGTTLFAGLGSNAAGDAEVWSCDMSTNCTDWAKIGGDAVNSSWTISTYESVTAMTVMGGNLYAGLSVTARDAEVWRWNGATWTKVGGDGVSSSWAAATNIEAVRSLTTDGTNVYAGLGDTAQDAEVWRYNGTTWTQIGGDGVSSSWSAASNIEAVYSLTYYSGNLYAGVGLTAGDADVWRYNGTTWTQIGGDNLNSGWAASTYEGVYAMTNDGTNLYAGVGNTNGDGEVFRWNGSAWTKIGGDGINSGFSANQGDGVYAMAYGNSTLYSGLYDAAGNGTLWGWNGSTWSWTGGAYVNASWGFYNLQSVEATATHDEKLYAGTGITVAGNAMIWEFDGSTWQVIGGQGVRGSWAADTFENVFALQSYNGDLYAGIGTTANDAEVWRYDGSTWTKVGGDSLNSGWTTNFEGVYSLTVYGGNLYAGLGASAQDAEVWRWNGSSWLRVGGDGVNSSWSAASNIEVVYTMTVFDGNLYAGLGATANDSDIWRYNGTTWTQVGGDGLGSSWNTVYEEVYMMRVYNNNLVVGLGSSTDDAEVWSYNGTTWTKIGGDDVNNSWTSGTYERIRAMAVYNGKLYAGVGDTAGDGEVWEWNGTTWTQIAGDSLNSGWTNVIEYVSTLIDYKGKLYAGVGNTANADAQIWSYGNNAFLSSAQTSQDTNWHHIAATYNGSTMKIFIDGVEDASASASVTIPDTSSALLIGSTYGSGGSGDAQGYFTGLIDEARISSTARTSFTTKPYVTSKKIIELNDAAYVGGVTSIDSFVADETLNGGSIGYRVSNDDGATWKYWDGDSWENAATENDSSIALVIDANIASLPVTFDGIRWQAVLSSDGNQRVTLNDITIEATSDIVAPATNADNLLAFTANGGSSIASNAWTNGASPFFSWDAGSDADSGVYGYCLYLGQDNAADPVTTKGLLGTSPLDTGGNCEFAVSGTSVDLATSGYIGTAMTSSNSPYYLHVKAIDAAGNVFGTNESFQFRFDNTAPTNPGFITAPSGFINTKEATLSWATIGGQSAADANSGVAGLQYRINASNWYGDSHSGTGDASDLLANDGTYQTTDPPDFANINEGVNTVYFRTWDQAGNVTSSYVTAALKVNTNGAPSEPVNVVATPSTNTTNSFAFSWDLPVTYVGDANNLSYCYTVNTEPSPSNCSFTSSRSLGAGPYATQPGDNIFYVVARDESSNINYDSYATATFNANTPSPGIATNVDIVDVSIKSTSNWRLALTWEPPTYSGAGVSSYKVYRSTDDVTYAFVGSSTSTTYIDAGLTQQTYYYYVRACDSTNNCSANSSDVNLLPTGKFTDPATLTSEPSVEGITTKKATISWTTDRASDSKVAIGTKSGEYSPSEVGSSEQVTAHEIDLDNLSAGTTYYYLVKWTDEDGNTGVSQEHSFTTDPAPVIKEVETTKIGLGSAIVSFTVKGATSASLYYGPSESFGGLETVNTSAEESRYSIEVAGLSDGQKYYYMVSAFDSEGNEYQGNIFSFSTPPRPRISNLRFQPVEGEPTSTQEITWTTNVPSTSTLTYGIVGTNGVDVQDSKLKTNHKLTIKGLQDDSRYFVIAQSRDADGNLAVSDRQEFRTALDTRPPEVFEITIEPSIRGTGAEARGQIIVSWKTDEPSTSQVAFAEGSEASVFNSRTTEDTQLTTEHIVVVSDLPTSRVYSIQAVSRDKASNAGLGESQSAIIGRASESVLTVIFNTLQRVFGL